jgi:hypothetical protein
VIAERVVLLRIEHLEQRRRGIAAEIGPSLSISSRMNTGFFDSARRSPGYCPGSAPM